MGALFKEPLVQFLIGGMLLFAVLGPETPDDVPDDTIRITDETLATYLQYRQKNFDMDAVRAQIDALPDEARTRLVADYVEEEILYREAVALGLESGDDIIRKRLIQKMDFLLQGFDGTNQEIAEDDLKAYYNSHADRYRQDARASFTHIFFSSRARGGPEAQAAATALAARAREGNLPHGEAGRFGDRFPYLRVYADRSQRLIREHLGTDLATEVFTAAPVGGWSGPYRSPLGYHLVFLHSRTGQNLPPFEEVAAAVRTDVQRDRRLAARQDAIESLRKKYTVEDGAGQR